MFKLKHFVFMSFPYYNILDYFINLIKSVLDFKEREVLLSKRPSNGQVKEVEWNKVVINIRSSHHSPEILYHNVLLGSIYSVTFIRLNLTIS